MEKAKDLMVQLKENKPLLIKVGAAAAGAVIGAVVAGVIASKTEDLSTIAELAASSENLFQD